MNANEAVIGSLSAVTLSLHTVPTDGADISYRPHHYGATVIGARTLRRRYYSAPTLSATAVSASTICSGRQNGLGQLTMQNGVVENHSSAMSRKNPLKQNVHINQ